MKEYFILDIDYGPHDYCLWWRPKNSGYTFCIDDAGRYTEEQVRNAESYYNNRKTTIAIPCELVEPRAIRVIDVMHRQSFKDIAKRESRNRKRRKEVAA